ncbi:homoserine o-acetyltransferase [Gamsiella multidivaricata]|uniref:homoserine o-acetyltransferase n=1 Tax=Gamsiella multidivaricata TaxID=101098 RepID=UPI00221EE221|nr:homoserine o-acetyltransferase [Gamsiella multidivaricata]KAG0363272.1 homoserine O- acetyltransferase [Gamsiella multidivaricata]KAI7831113.1 homoserine o-acetyltransferase [Gamsiella multidivaricata]
MPFERRTTQPENPFSRLVPEQTIAIVPEFTFESGYTIRDVPVAYKTWGVLSEAGDNCMLICHPLTRSVDVEDWWSSLMGKCELEGKGKVIDESKFFIVCLNVMGSPYGSASSLTMNPKTGVRYGPEFPQATIRDDCRLHKLVLDDLGVKSVAICIGGSMAGMHVFEWSFFGQDYIKALVPVSAPAQSSAWSMGWTESQRQSIFADPKYLDGYYSLDAQPLQGMTAARMTAMLTYRTRVSYERRFGRNIMDSSDPTSVEKSMIAPAEVHRQEHNAGHRLMKTNPTLPSGNTMTGLRTPGESPLLHGSSALTEDPCPASQNPVNAIYCPPVYATHSYLRYQADKFNERFDANCYIALSRKMDGHDISRGRGEYADVIRDIQQPTLVLGIDSDVLYPFAEIEALSKLLPKSELVCVRSEEGHDGILLEYEQVNDAIVAFMQRHDHIREILSRQGVAVPERKGPRGTMFASW